jgi:hypothetical protein
MSATRNPPTAKLFLLEELDGAVVAEPDLDALRTVAGWIKSFIVKPNGELGRPGPVCPFVPVSLERDTLWLAPEHVAGRSAADVVEVVRGYQRLFLDAQPTQGGGTIYKAIVVVFTDLSPAAAGQLFDDVLKELSVSSYVDNGFVMGGSFEGNEAGAIYNASFKPFTSPVPFFLIRQGVTSDWKFFLDDDQWFTLWAGRYAADGTQALASELRRLPWRELPKSPG